MISIKQPARWLLIAGLAWIAGPAQAQSSLYITEFMADNSRTLLDQDGDFEDWLELFNSGDTEVQLGGYFLTDDSKSLKQWEMPAVALGPHRSLIIFCSGKDRRNPQSELHTNFKLENGGEDLLLVSPDGATPVAGFGDYPIQIPDVSFGVASDSKFEKPVLAGTPARVLVPANGDLALTWTGLEFDDLAWTEGRMAAGYGVKSPELDVLGADLGPTMLNVNPTVYIRIPFDVPDPTRIDLIKLRMKYDDGFAAFLNGVPVAASNTPALLEWNSKATRSHTGTAFEDFNISEFLSALRPGKNLLAIQGLNTTASNNDLYILPEVVTVDVGQLLPGTTWYFQTPTPGEPNNDGIPSLAPKPTIGPAPGVYVTSALVEISTTLAGSVIRYTQDGTVPTESSPIYTAPFEITSPTYVGARVFKDGYVPGPTEFRAVIIIANALATYKSNLPLVICTTFGRTFGTNCGGGPYTQGFFIVIYPGQDGVAEIIGDSEVSHRAAFRRRGSSTCGNEKFAFNVEVQDPQGRDDSIDVPGFPRESDYIMYAPNNFDRALIRNPIAYWMSREVGPWASRTQNVECFFHTQKTAISTTHYYGVYNFMEKNKQNPKKVDIHQISPQDNQEPEVTGGYLMKRDRVGAEEVAISAGGYGSLVFVYPKKPTPAQRTYMTQHITKVLASLKPTNGSQADNELIDFQEWLDHHILNWYPKNVDGFRLSGYFHKDRGKPMAMGPVWDYDRTMGCSDDDRARDPLGWDNDNVGDGGTRYFQPGDLGSWYSTLFQNAPPTKNTPWNNAYKARWRELRREKLRTDRILEQIDLWAGELQQPAQRNFQKWRSMPPRFGSFQGEINHLKNWLADRADWIDSQFIETPRFSHPSGTIEKGLEISILVDSDSRIYYTVDGSDPRGAGNQPGARAILFTGPIPVTQNIKIIARALELGGVWSSTAEAIYITDPVPLTVTELMYFPVKLTIEEDPLQRYNATNMEFIEIANTGSEPLSLKNIKFSIGVTFDFTTGAVDSLQPGEAAVIVQNIDAFKTRYKNAAIRIAGAYTGSLTDRGERLTLNGPTGEVILEFIYSSTWQPNTSGLGYSLVSIDPSGSPDTLGESERWKTSDALYGTPGTVESIGAGGLRRPGDVTQDGKLNITDVTGLLRILYLGTGSLPCSGDNPEAGGNKTLLDADGDGSVNLTDAIHELHYLFQSGPPHAAGTQCVRVAGCAEACVQ